MDNPFKTNVAFFETETGDKILRPFSPPIFQTIVDTTFTKELIEKGRQLNIEENDHSPRLAGNLKYGRSYHYTDDYLDKVEPYLTTYVERFFNGLYQQLGNDYKGVNSLLQIHEDRHKTRPGKVKLDSLWINFQNKHDFNPPHKHSGILSFVIYCQVPEEIFSVNADSNSPKAGQICFLNGEPTTEIVGNEYPVKPFDNLMFIFPSSLLHYVPSYWIDAERITVSGNFIKV